MKKVAIIGAGISGLYIANLFKRNPNYQIMIYEKNNSISLEGGYGIQLSVNSANSGEGNEKIKAEFSSESLNISFNSKYLIDIAAELEDKNLKMKLKDAISPVLIEDNSDKNSYYVIMPMKI